MGLTQVSTDGVKNDAITKTKIPANQIEASELADNAVDTNAIADQAVALSKLPHGDSNNNGKFLRANNGADPTFETVSTDLVADTSPQLGADLDVNDFNIKNGTSLIDITENNRIEVDIAGTEIVDINGSGIDIVGDVDVTGTLKLADAIEHTGDTNTKIRFPANDHISMESAGSEVFRVTPDEGHGTSHSIRLKSAHTVDGAAVCIGGTKAYSAGIIRGMANIRDGNAYNVTDNGGGIGFSAVFNSGGSHTTMSQIEGVKANNTDGNYEGAIKFSTRHHNGNMVEKVRIGQEGLSFEGATAAANCLDDYEEGSFSPIIRTIGSSTGQQTGTGRYTKIGNKVFIQVQFDNKNCSSIQNGNYIQIANIPFTAANYPCTSTVPQAYKIDWNGDRVQSFVTASNTTTLEGFESRSGGSWQPWASANFRKSQIYLRFNLTYFTDS